MGDHPIQNAGRFVGAGFGPLGYIVGNKAGAQADKVLAPDIPQARALPAPPNPDDPAVQKDLSDAEAAQRRARGMASTILTSGRGVSGQMTTARQTLLGA